jgi:hypothetical protein
LRRADVDLIFTKSKGKGWVGRPFAHCLTSYLICTHALMH